MLLVLCMHAYKYDVVQVSAVTGVKMPYSTEADKMLLCWFVESFFERKLKCLHGGRGVLSRPFFASPCSLETADS